jgi:hypothetical protein
MTTDLSVVDPLISLGGTIPGFISGRLMAAYQLDHEHIIHVSRDSVTGYRTTWSYVLERNGTVIFEAADFSAGTNLTYGEAAREVLGFLTTGADDVEDDYFNDYTPGQIAWRDECAEDLVMFGMEDD